MAETQTNGHDKTADKVAKKRAYAREYYRKHYAKKKGKKAASKPQGKKDHSRDDAIYYLRKAVRSINARIAAGGEETMADLMTKLALKTLQGEF